MYIPDLSRDQFLQEPLCIAIGWLGDQHPYLQGTPPDGFVERLWVFCKAHVHATLGIQDCELCQPPTTIYEVRRGDESAFLGTAEIRVFGAGTTIYAAPTLIYHYVVDHRYLPAAEFIQAILTSPLPNSPEYRARSRQERWD